MVLKKVAAVIALTAIAQVATAAELKSDADKLSYSLGAFFGQNLKSEFDDLNTEMVKQGIADALEGKKLEMSAEDMQKVLMKAQQKKLEEQQKKMAEEAKLNLEAGNAFLAKNKKAAGVKETASGLQYQVIKMGDGPKPSLDSTVTVDYEGSLVDGTVFDSSYKRGEPATFPLKNVIKGWQEGLQLMPVGSKFKFTIPAKLAYGAVGPAGIGPNQVLVFTVELKGIKKMDTKPSAK